MRFETIAAFVVGIGLPLAEVARRRTDFSDLPAYVDDFLFGALLLFAAFRSRRGHPSGPALLAAAWGVFCGAMYYSFFGQLDTTGAKDISGLPNGLVIGVKAVLLIVGLVALFRSVLSARRTGTSP